MILLVRHALAVPRGSWPREDRLRPLSDRGTRQAQGLVELLGTCSFERILSSPALRCKATVTPLAQARGSALETSRALREGRGGHALDLVLDLVDDTVVCTHGDVVGIVLKGLRHLGWPIPARPRQAKGATWVLRRESCEYLPPPA